jgi:hypothetical protein
MTSSEESASDCMLLILRREEKEEAISESGLSKRAHSGRDYHEQHSTAHTMVQFHIGWKVYKLQEKSLDINYRTNLSYFCVCARTTLNESKVSCRVGRREK